MPIAGASDRGGPKDTDSDAEQGREPAVEPEEGPPVESAADKVPDEIDRDLRRFRGRFELRNRRNISQDLGIEFDLEITPNTDAQGPVVRCRILIDNLVVSATKGSDRQGERTKPYVLELMSLSISATDGECWLPEDIKPVSTFFSVSQTETQTRGIEASLGFGPRGPTTGIAISAGQSKAVEMPPINIAIRPRHIGTGGSLQEHKWEYQVQPASRSRVELSTKQPPEHQLTFPFPKSDSHSIPSNFWIKVEVVARKAKFLSGWKDVVSPAQWQQNWSFGHLKLVLEARVGQDADDYFKFPTRDKVGQKRHLIFEFKETIGQGVPRIIDHQSVQCCLKCLNVRKH